VEDTHIVEEDQFARLHIYNTLMLHGKRLYDVQRFALLRCGGRHILGSGEAFSSQKWIAIEIHYHLAVEVVE
jgi:hypothetical protein